MGWSPGERNSQCARELFQYVDQPCCRLKHRHTLRQFFPAIDFVEQSHCAFVSGMFARGAAERLQPRRQCGATVFKLIIALAKALPFGCPGVGLTLLAWILRRNRGCRAVGIKAGPQLMLLRNWAQ